MEPVLRLTEFGDSHALALARYYVHVTLSRFLSIGGALLFVGGIVIATVGPQIVGMATASCGGVFLVSWVFLLVGLSEDRARERGEH